MARFSLLVALIITVVQTRAEIIYVNAVALGTNDGISWESAYVDLQTALSDSVAGDEIWVAAGTYHASNTNNRGESYILREGVGVYGGFVGTESERPARDWRKYATLLSGNIGDSAELSDNSFRIIIAKDVGPDAILDGFVIEHAYNDREYPEGVGGGIYTETSAPTIRNCVFRDDVALGGGAAWNLNASPRFENCVFKRTSDIACYNDGSDAQYLNCTFRRNRGGAGAALYARNGSDLLVLRCLLVGNTSDGDGGAYYGYGNPVFRDSVFLRNRAIREGGSYGGAMELRAGSATITNCTIIKNWSAFNSGGITTFSPTSQPTIRNCVLWGNRSANGERHGWTEGDQCVLHAGTMKLCLVEGYTGLYGGRSNFDGDPLFVDVEGRNFRLRAGSPCIDRGKDEAVTKTTDLDGNPRILSGRVDLGAYESVCEGVRQFEVDARENDSGGYDVTASLKTHLPAGSTVRVTFASEQGGDEPRIRRARIDADGRGKASLPDCPSGRVTVCIEGCGEGLCREVECP